MYEMNPAQESADSSVEPTEPSQLSGVERLKHRAKDILISDGFGVFLPLGMIVCAVVSVGALLLQ